MTEVLSILAPIFAIYAVAGAIAWLIIGPLFYRHHPRKP